MMRQFLLLRAFPAITCRNKCKLSRDNYKFPELLKEDLEQQLVAGHGPGGMNVNAARNCCILKHIPTGLVVKMHESRSIFRNIEMAHERMVDKLDAHLNGENCFAAQKKRELQTKEQSRFDSREKMRLMKAKYKEMAKRRPGVVQSARVGDENSGEE